MPCTAENYLSLDDFERAARRYLPRCIFGYVSSGSETNRTLTNNRNVFSDYVFVPRVLRDASKRRQETTLFGRTFSSPFGIAPMGVSALTAYRGDIMLARGAAAANIPMIMSGASLIRMEDVIAENRSIWFQAYVPGDVERIAPLLDRAEKAGFETLVFTVDVPVTGNRENAIRTWFSTPMRPSLHLMWEGITHPSWLFNTALKTLVRHGMPHFENPGATRGAPILSRNGVRDFGAKDHLSWKHFEFIRRRWKGRLVVKGILNKDDALRARDSGADGIIVSNHGGRQLDGTVSPLHVIAGIVRVLGDFPVLADSGFRRGTDILKALALGAKFVFIGRPFNYAASVAGESGVIRVARILAEEISRDMAILGINNLSELGPESIMRIRGQLCSTKVNSAA
jgi:L-lactate dehydrogenase (cytochrome)